MKTVKGDKRAEEIHTRTQNTTVRIKIFYAAGKCG